LARKILLADDSVTAQNMGRKILADAGYEVITVNNGSAALKKIAEQKPDLIVLDVYMPGYSGLEVCQRLKDAQETARVPVLLTVGKLEPFKPEEAKRVRADGFIVKPFEASELLSALSKLEDKIVPRAEVSKPGRFARVTASIEEGRYDKTVAVEEDVGWKDRISFPAKQKERSAFEDGQSGANPKPLLVPRAIKPEEPKVDLGALAPEGLPKDVTPEEIAALAAAAAQVKGKIADSKPEEPTSIAGRTEEYPLAASVVEQKSEGRFENSAEKSPEKIEENRDASPTSTEAPEAASVAAATHSDLMAAIAGLDPGAAALPSPSSSNTSVGNSSLGNSLSPQSAPEQHANEPVTLALGASPGTAVDAPRWTAVSIALGQEEAATSLEQEMQKAYAAFAAAVNGRTSEGLEVPGTGTDSARLPAPADSLPHLSLPEVALSEPITSIPAMPAPQAIQTLSTALGNASTDAIRAAVQELEMVAESFVGESAPSEWLGPAPLAEVASASPFAPAVSSTDEASVKENPTNAHEERQEAATLETIKQDQSAPERHAETIQGCKGEALQNEVQRAEDSRNDAWRNEPAIVAAAEPALQERHATAADKQGSTASTFSSVAPTEQNSPKQNFTNQNPANQVPSSQETVTAEPAAGGETTKKESDGASTTAAAWASWRRIRETGDSQAASDEPTQKEVEQTRTTQDAAAMAVAAGAEKTPGPSDSESDPAAIASIVDSVLADLRPRIFEEISRKMGKK